MQSIDNIKDLLFNFDNIKRKNYTQINWIYLDYFEPLIRKKDNVIIDENSIKIKINGEICQFYQTLYGYGSTSKYYQCENKYFIKFPLKKENGILEREIFILNKLKDYEHFPKIILTTDDFLVLTWCGERLNINNIPNNIYYQIDEISNILLKEEINHTDIKDEELLIKDGILFLVDFGWGKYKGRHDCELNIPNVSLAENKFTDDKQTLIDVIERIKNPVLFLKKNLFLKNHKNIKWLGYKNMKQIKR